jgi:hypothetical protein
MDGRGDGRGGVGLSLARHTLRSDHDKKITSNRSAIIEAALDMYFLSFDGG